MSKKFLFLTAALFAVILLSGCSSSATVRGNTWPGLSATNDVAYLADGAFVYAIKVSDGTEVWHYPDQRSTKYIFYSTPYITSDGLVIVGSSGSSFSLMALDPSRIDATTKSPTVAWTFSDVRNHWIATPVAIENKLYAPNSDGNLYVLDISNGQLIKTVDLGGDLWSQPVTDGKNLYISTLDHNMIAMDKDTYQILWQQDLGSAITSAPILASDGNLYVGSFTSNLEKFDPANGDHEAVQKTTDWVWGTPGEIEKNLYFGDLAGNFYSYNLETGKYNWNAITLKPDNWAPNSTKAPDESKATAITASPVALQDGSILVATESGALYKVDQQGNQTLWGGQQQQPGGKIYTTPVVVGDLVLVSPMTADAYLYAYDLNGTQKWAFAPAK